jgi:hypothetical protein
MGVVCENDRVLDTVLITVMQNEEYVYSTTSSNFEIELYPGIYSIIATLEGYYPVTIEDIIVVANETTYIGNIVFEYAISIDDPLEPITRTGLIGNFPNPFNPETTITFAVEADALGCHITINIINVRGQLVRSLVSGYWSSGYHSVIWDGRDDDGNHVGSGVYFYVMQTENMTESRRMLLLR